MASRPLLLLLLCLPLFSGLPFMLRDMSAALSLFSCLPLMHRNMSALPQFVALMAASKLPTVTNPYFREFNFTNSSKARWLRRLVVNHPHDCSLNIGQRRGLTRLADDHASEVLPRCTECAAPRPRAPQTP